MKNIACIILLIAAFSFTNVNAQKREFTKIKKKKEYTTSSGLKMIFYDVNKKGEFADSGDVVDVNYRGMLTDGKEFDNSYDRGRPISFTLGTGRVIKGWEEVLRYMRRGDSLKVTIPPELAYGKRAVGTIPPNSTLVFYMKLVSLKKPVKPYDVTGLDTVKLASGLAYIVVKKGRGASVKEGNRAIVRYTGYFIDGRKFDSSFDHPGAEDFDFIIGRHQVIEGWEKGVVGMRKGEKRRLIVPYKMAYGEQGRNPVIPPKADLVFDVELVDYEIVTPPKVFDVSGKDTVTTASGLQYIAVKKTKGRQVKAGDTVTVFYTGYFRNGKIFDSSVERGDSIMLIVGRHMVIPGWDEGLQKMKEGEKYRFIIPYKLAYGEQGRPPIIPPKSDLIFDVYLKKVGK